MLGDILAGLQLYDRFKKKTSKNIDVHKEDLVTRFVALFESHGVSRNQIPEFFKHDLDIYTCSKDEELLKSLNPQILADASALFATNKDWLEGSSDEVYSIMDFYKHPESFESYLKELVPSKKENQMMAYVLKADKSSLSRDYDSLIVIAEPIGELNDREIYKYHLLGQWVNRYWKSRAYLTACCALLYKYGFMVCGSVVKRNWLEEVIDKTVLLDYNFDDKQGGLNFPTRGSWIVADFIEMPDEFLKGMDTEGGCATTLAIQMWLDLSDCGYMRCFPEHDEDHIGVEQSYKSKLKSLNV